jgi:hypothetical protein
MIVMRHKNSQSIGVSIWLDANKSGNLFVQTVDNNKKLFMKGQIAEATKARNVYKLLHCTSKAVFDNIIHRRHQGMPSNIGEY